MSQSVFIVDDDPAVRDSISLWLSCHGYDTRCFADAKHFLDQVTQTLEGCIIADIRMPSMDGLELQAHLNKINCQLPLIFITGHGTVPMAVEAIKNGALDYLRKPVDEMQLLQKVKEGFVIDSINNQKRQRSLQHQSRLNSLTKRELEVLELVVAGTSNKVIASGLSISHRTVEVHRAKVMLKLGAKTLPQLVKSYLTMLESSY
ncbi:MAG: response regulator [Oceanospirillaceae bacterium]|jgi:FixJ family two-component response regulator